MRSRRISASRGLRSGKRSGTGRRCRALRRHSADPDTAGQRDVRHERLSTYNVLEAAAKLGDPQGIIASSETVRRLLRRGRRDFDSFPVDEDHDADPMDSYGLSKVVGEKIARAFATRTGADITRFGSAQSPTRKIIERFPAAHGRAALAASGTPGVISTPRPRADRHLCIEKDGLGFQVFNATNDEIIATNSRLPISRQARAKHADTREMGGFEAPLSNRKAREHLGFREEHNWRKHACAVLSRER